MYRIIKTGRKVQIGFDNKAECYACWKSPGFIKNRHCMLFICNGDEQMINEEGMEYSLNDLDHFSLTVNCIGFIEMPKSLFEKFEYHFKEYFAVKS